MLLRIISSAPSPTTLTLLQTGTTTGYALLANASFGDVDWQHQFSGPVGSQGARPSPGIPQNRTVNLPLRITGSSKDDLDAKIRALEQAVEELRRFGGRIAWQSNNQTPRQWFRVMTAARQYAEWGSRAEVLNRAVVVVAATCAPYVEGDPMDVFDQFFAPSAITDYTFDTGAGTASLDNTVGRMNFSDTTEKRFYHNLSGYQVPDAEVTIHYQVGSTGASPGVFLRRIDASNYLLALIDVTGTALSIWKVVAGVFTLLGRVTITTIAAATDYWIRFRSDGNVLTAEHWTAVPRPQATAANNVVYQLTATDQATFGRTVKGQTGVRFIPAGTLASNFITDYRSEPYTYRGITMPIELNILGIPGSADALADAWFMQSPSAAHSDSYGALGWSRAVREPYNLIWNGGFENGTNGWSVAAGFGNSAATSIAATGSVLYGYAAGRIVTPGAAANEGANFHIYRTFKRGRTYTWSVWARSNTGASQSIVLVLGQGAGDFAQSGTFTLAANGAWQLLTLTWTPTADRQEAFAVIRAGGTFAYTFDVDGATVYEGTTAPTAVTQTQGRGGYPPIGILNGAAISTGQSPGVSISADSNAYSGYRAGAAIGSTGAWNLGPFAWRIDPGLLATDDYQLGSVDIEFWGRLLVSGDHSNVQVSLRSYMSADYSAGSIGTPGGTFTREYGSGFKTLQLPSAGTEAYRIYRLGTMSFPAAGAYTPRAPVILFMYVNGTATLTGHNFAVCHLAMAPARDRCTSPSGADKGAGYPFFTGGVATTPIRIVRSNLTGLFGIWQPNAPTPDLYPTAGLGGAPIEISAGDALVIPRVTYDLPDTPWTFGAADTLTDNQNMGFHLAVTPRWGLLRDV